LPTLTSPSAIQSGVRLVPGAPFVDLQVADALPDRIEAALG
jgi:hypothetical protein